MLRHYSVGMLSVAVGQTEDERIDGGEGDKFQMLKMAMRWGSFRIVVFLICGQASESGNTLWCWCFSRHNSVFPAGLRFATRLRGWEGSEAWRIGLEPILSSLTLYAAW